MQHLGSSLEMRWLLVLLVAFVATARGQSQDNNAPQFAAVGAGPDDAEGFILFCPCVGRFGSQVDSLLGALVLAKNVNRTLVLPPFVFPGPKNERFDFVPFEEIFEVSAIARVHRVITLDTFMAQHGSRWAPRWGFCFRRSDDVDEPSECNLKNGRPFGPFWDRVHVSFDGSIHIPFTLANWSPSAVLAWDATVPRSQYPYVALPTAPAEIPLRREHTYLQQFLQWRPQLLQAAATYVDRNLREPFVAVHMRNGVDWVSACKGIEGRTSFLASPQCVQEDMPLKRSMCLPTFPQILQRVRQAIARTRAQSVFILTDNNALVPVFASELSLPVSVLTDDAATALTGPMSVNSRVFLDLIIASQADQFVGNCISSFSAFIKRARDVMGLPTLFISVPDV